MHDRQVADSIEQLSALLHTASDEALGRSWEWGDYTDEGVRFAGFVAYGHVREITALAAAERVQAGVAPTIAQRILAQYQLAYRDMQALMLGINAQTAELAPAEGEWPLRQVVQHMVDADTGFYAMMRTNIDRHRAGTWNGEGLADADYERYMGIPETAFMEIMNGPLVGIQTYHADIHDRILAELSDISDAETELPAKYWESVVYPVRFRLQRFEAHLRQHSIQLEKTLAGIGRPPSEGQRLARLLYAGLAELEGSLIGAPETALAAQQEMAEAIAELAEEAERVLNA